MRFHSLRNSNYLKCYLSRNIVEGSKSLSPHSFHFSSGRFSTDTSVTHEEVSPGAAAPGLEGKQLYNQREALPVTFSDISRANVAIRTGIKRTTCEKSYFLSELIGANM